MSILHQQKSFLDTNAWQKPNINSLRYNTSQAGSVLPLVYGTTRQSVNLIALGDYRGPNGGKKGKSSGPLPLSGTHVGKGGGGGKKGAGGKKSSDYSIDVDFALCQGPVDIPGTNLVWASGGTAMFRSVGLNLYSGEDGQAVDPVFDALGDIVGYSGTCHVTGTPMDLGPSPVLPNLSFEITGFQTGTLGSNYNRDANPAHCILDFLTNSRYGAGFPIAHIDPDLTTSGANSYADYCQAAELAVSVSLNSQTDAATWISELARLTNTAIVWSGSVLKFLPYGDLALSADSAVWTPNLVPAYSFTDNDFLPWNAHIESSDPQEGDDDPVIITRSNPADATNWMSIEYLDRQNQYNKTLLAQFDQGSIDAYGIRTEAAINGNCFCSQTPAENSVKLLLQRALYVRNTYKFQVGWQYSQIEPMDIVLLTDAACGLDGQAVRVTAIEENENGDLVIDAEEIKTDDTPLPPDACINGTVDWRMQYGNDADTYAMPPDRLDSNGYYWTVDPYDASWNYVAAFDSSGALVHQITYPDLFQKIYAFTGVWHDPILAFDNPANGPSWYGYYGVWPILGGKYLLAHVRRQHTYQDYAFWWAILDAGSLDVVGAYWYKGLTVWPYNDGKHVLECVSEDQPILVLTYIEWPTTSPTLGTLPSINEFRNRTYESGFGSGAAAYQVPNTMLFPIGSDSGANKDFGFSLISAIQPGNASRNWGFVLPGADGTPIFYMYVNREVMDGIKNSTTTYPPEFKYVIQPANPFGCMIKIPLGNLDYRDLATHPLVGVNDASPVSHNPFPYFGRPTGVYTVDNAAWTDDTGAAAIPFLDEYTHLSDDTVGGTDCYSLQTSVIDRGNGVYWVIFYMVGRDDGVYRINHGEDATGTYSYPRPVYERVKIFQYTASSETAQLFNTQTCILHDTDDMPGDEFYEQFWEPTNDNFQIFTMTDDGRVATLTVHGAFFAKAFETANFPVGG